MHAYAKEEESRRGGGGGYNLKRQRDKIERSYADYYIDNLQTLTWIEYKR
jgi:hypothetical protein